MTHYERLRLPPTATPAQIRDAYRREARTAHPDRDARSGAQARMAEINEAYRILSDPSRRRRYDAEISATRAQATAAAGRTAAEPEPREAPEYVYVADATPARFPWKFMAVLASLGIGVIVLGLIFTKPVAPSEPDNLLRPGECVDISQALEASEVRCDGPHDAVVEALIPSDRTCATDTEAYRDRQGMGTACVVRVGS